MPSCDSCVHNNCDPEYDEYYCDMDIDEDEVARIAFRDAIVGAKTSRQCPYYRHGDEYTTVRKQI